MAEPVVLGAMMEEFLRWTPMSFWQDLDPLCKATAIVLVVMLVHTLFILATRLFRYEMARRQGQPIRRLLESQGFSVGELVELANAHKGSHIASVVLTGIEVFQTVAPQFTNREAVDSADRAMTRCGYRAHAQMRLGLNTLATMASVAPFVGLLGTTVGIFSSFGGSSTQKATLMAWIANNIARALVLTAASLAVGVIALCSYNYLTRKLELLDAQVTAAILHIVTFLRGQSSQHPSAAVLEGESVATGLLSASRAAEIPYERWHLLLPYLWALWIYFMYVATAMYWHFAG